MSSGASPALGRAGSPLYMSGETDSKEDRRRETTASHGARLQGAAEEVGSPGRRKGGARERKSAAAAVTATRAVRETSSPAGRGVSSPEKRVSSPLRRFLQRRRSRASASMSPQKAAAAGDAKSGDTERKDAGSDVENKSVWRDPGRSTSRDPLSSLDANVGALRISTEGSGTSSTSAGVAPLLHGHHRRKTKPYVAGIRAAGPEVVVAASPSPTKLNAVLRGLNLGIHKRSPRLSREASTATDMTTEKKVDSDDTDFDSEDSDGRVRVYRGIDDYHRGRGLSDQSALSHLDFEGSRRPRPSINSEADWRRAERGLFRRSEALNEDIFDFAIVLKKEIDPTFALWARDVEAGAVLPVVGDALRHVESGLMGESLAVIDVSDDETADAQRCRNCKALCAGCMCSCKCTLPPLLVTCCRVCTLGRCLLDRSERRRREMIAREKRCLIILNALRRVGLIAKKVKSLDKRALLIKVRATDMTLEEVAERIKLRVKRNDGRWSKFKRHKRDVFFRAGVPIFRSSDRQLIIDHLIRSKEDDGGAGLGRETVLGQHIESAFPLHMYARLIELRNDWLSFWKPPMNRRNRTVTQHNLFEDPAASDKLRGAGGDDESVAETEVHVIVSRSSLSHVPSTFSLGFGRGRPSGLARGGLGSIKEDAQRASPTKVAGTVRNGEIIARRRLQQAARQGEGDGKSSGRKKKCKCCGCGCLRKQCTKCAKCVVRGCARAAQSSCDCLGRAACCALKVVCCPCWCCCCRSRKKNRHDGGEDEQPRRRVGCTTVAQNMIESVLYQPLDRIASYFGETVAFYFAWLEFYTRWLIFPAIAGVALFIAQVVSGDLDHPMVPLYSLFIAVWSALFIEFWRRRNYELAHRWGVLNFAREEVTRPEFRGELRVHAGTGDTDLHYPSWKRWLKYVVTLVIVLGWSVGVMWLMIYIFSTRDDLLARLANETSTEEIPQAPNVTSGYTYNTTYSDGFAVRFLQADSGNVDADDFAEMQQSIIDRANAAQQNLADLADTAADQADGVGLNSLFVHSNRAEWWLALLLPSCLYGFMIPLLDFLFGRLANLLNRWENHKTESQYRNRLIAKVFSFRFVNCFVSLYYYAFSTEHTMLVLSVQLAGFVLANQVWNNLVEVVIPCMTRKWLRKRMKRKLEKAARTHKGRRGKLLLRQARSKAWQESQQPAYDTFEDYAEMLIQFGYVTFFSVAFPLAPLLAMLNNFVEIRGDAYKLCYNTRRPVARKAGGIGVWFSVLRIMSLLAVLTNCAHIAFTSKWLHMYFPWVTGQDNGSKILIVFIFEHVVLSLRVLVTLMVPQVPDSVRRRVDNENRRNSENSNSHHELISLPAR